MKYVHFRLLFSYTVGDGIVIVVYAILALMLNLFTLQPTDEDMEWGHGVADG